MKKRKINLAFMLFTLMLLNSCGKSAEIFDELSQLLSVNNLKGTWVVTEASSTIWEENVGVISQTVDNETLGATLRFTDTSVVISNMGQTFTYPYTINLLANTLSLEVGSNEFDVFDVETFSLPNMVLLNPEPEAGDYQFESDYNANVYKQKKITLVKQ